MCFLKLAECELSALQTQVVQALWGKEHSQAGNTPTFWGICLFCLCIRYHWHRSGMTYSHVQKYWKKKHITMNTSGISFDINIAMVKQESMWWSVRASLTEVSSQKRDLSSLRWVVHCRSSFSSLGHHYDSCLRTSDSRSDCMSDPPLLLNKISTQLNLLRQADCLWW